MKVFELSKELNVENKELIQVLLDLGIEIKSHLSALTDEQVELIKSTVGINSNDVVKESKTQTVVKQPWKPDLQRTICIKNISRGKLIYKSKRITGYTVIWDKKGSKNYLELGEFIALKNSDMRFVTEPWIRIMEDDEVEILKYANIYQYYKDILDVNNIKDILLQDFEGFKKKFDKFPEGYKNTVVEQAAEMIREGTLDSIKIKNYIEEAMGIDLSILTKKPTKKKIESIEIQ